MGRTRTRVPPRAGSDRIPPRMSYTVLARRYRSGNFDELIGQDHIARTLKKAIASGRIAHAYLFCGTRGTGKTSTARILAKCLNCERSDGPTADPCSECNSCTAIARGDDIDVIEIDAASNTGVDNVRDLISNSQFRPARSRFKVYIIDEVHALSKNAFNALLKTLEEPPSHVKFILATTEPEKVLPTILSRCQRYDFRNIPTREIAAHLKSIVSQEKVNADEDALLLVAKAGAGSMRDALSLLDRLLSIGEDRLTVESLEQLLGLPKSQLLFELADKIGSGDTKGVLRQADSIINGGLSPDSLVAALVEHLRNLLIIRTCGMDRDLVEVPGLSPAELQRQAEKFDAVALTQDIAILEELRRHMRQSQGGRALLDATLVRMTLADQFSSISDLLSGLDNGNMPSAKPARPPGSGVAPRLPVQSPAQKKNDVVEQVPPPLPVPAAQSTPAPASTASSNDEDDDLPRPGKVWDNSGPSLVELMRQQQAAPQPQDAASPEAPATPATAPSADANVESVAPQDLPEIWKQVLADLAAHGPGLPSLLGHGRLAEVNAENVVIRYEPKHETFLKMLDRNGKKELVRDAMTQVLKRPIGVSFEIDPVISDGVAEATPPVAAVARPARPAPRLQREVEVPSAPMQRVTPEMVESLRAEQPLVKALMDSLGGQVIKVESGTNNV
jgi:DNA polymerase-3 subunit gamma/tau